MTPNRVRVLMASFGRPAADAEFGGPALIAALTGQPRNDPVATATYALVPAQAMAIDASPLPPQPTVTVELTAMHEPTLMVAQTAYDGVVLIVVDADEDASTEDARVWLHRARDEAAGAPASFAFDTISILLGRRAGLPRIDAGTLARAAAPFNESADDVPSPPTRQNVIPVRRLERPFGACLASELHSLWHRVGVSRIAPAKPTI